MSRSILQRKDGICYLCEMLHGNDGHYTSIEEHHVFEGWANRRKSEHWGLKIYLCNEHHNQTNSESIHNNEEIETMVKQIAQRAFEERYGHSEFMAEFGKNYLDEEEWFETELELVPEKKVVDNGMRFCEEAIDVDFGLWEQGGQYCFAF